MKLKNLTSKKEIKKILAMKKIMTISQLLIILFISSHLNAQNPRLEVQYSVVAESSSKSADAQLIITVDGERPPFVYQLFDKAPWEGGKELAKSEKSLGSKFSFDRLKNEKYFVCVTDAEGNSKCEYVLIKSE